MLAYATDLPAVRPASPRCPSAGPHNVPVRTPTRLSYRPELDGVRAIAVLGVLGFHLSFMDPRLRYIAGGGFLGVDVFFVLSGMLITQLLLAEYAQTGSLGLPGFYARRARRLLPALAALLVIYLVYSSLVHSDGGAILRGLWSELSYETTGQLTAPYPNGISQTWTLVVEWEFYLIWPFVMWALLRRGSRQTLLAVTVGLALLDAVARGLVYHHNHDFILGYHLAGFRIDELLIGSALAQLPRPSRVPTAVRTVAAAGVLVAIGAARYPQSWLYLGGMTALALATAAVIAPGTGGWFGQWVLSLPPLVWLGRISYSLYLWHVPAVTEIGHRTTGWPNPIRVVVSIAVSLLLASASYYLVEQRFRRSSRRALHDDAELMGQTDGTSVATSVRPS